MRKIFLVFILLSATIRTNSQYKVVTWSDILLERSIEELHKTLIHSKDREDREFLKNQLLIHEDGYLIENNLLDTLTTKLIKEKSLSRNLLCNKKVFFKIFRLLNVEGLTFLKTTIKTINNRYYVFFDTMWVTRTKDNELYFKQYNTFALYIYQWDDNFSDGDYKLESFEIFNQNNK